MPQPWPNASSLWLWLARTRESSLVTAGIDKQADASEAVRVLEAPRLQGRPSRLTFPRDQPRIEQWSCRACLDRLGGGFQHAFQGRN